MSELKANKISPSMVKLVRFIGTFSNRFFATFAAMTLGYGIAKNYTHFKSSNFGLSAFYLSCIIVTAIWSYYIIQITPPLIYRPIRRKEKSNLIRTRITVIVLLFIFKKGVQDLFQKSDSFFYVPLDYVLSLAMLSSFITLIILLFKKPAAAGRGRYGKGKTYKTQANRKNTDRAKEAGKEGEEKITYELSHLNKGKSTAFHNITIEVNGDVQQLDHLIIGENGIYNIETKTYNGNIRIDEFGNWSRDALCNGKWKGMQNPLAQTQRHRRALVSLLGEQYPIYDIIAMGNEETVIEGGANSPIPILTGGTLQYYIEEKTKGEKILTVSERQALDDKVQKAIIENKAFQ
jgi:hypothetical protein